MGRSPFLKNVDCLTFLFRAKNDGLDPVLRGFSAVRVVKNVWCLSSLIYFFIIPGIPSWTRKDPFHFRKHEELTNSVLLSDICDPGWSYFNNYCYFTSVSCTNWTTAVQKCRQEDLVLVDVSSNEENVVKSWLGLNDRTIEGNFTWVDRGQGNFTAWAKNQPNNFREEDCVHALGVEYSYEWNDVQCSDCHPCTCKKGKTWIIVVWPN